MEVQPFGTPFRVLARCFGFERITTFFDAASFSVVGVLAFKRQVVSGRLS